MHGLIFVFTEVAIQVFLKTILAEIMSVLYPEIIQRKLLLLQQQIYRNIFKIPLEGCFRTAKYLVNQVVWISWDRVFKNGQSKICGRQPLKIS